MEVKKAIQIGHLVINLVVFLLLLTPVAIAYWQFQETEFLNKTMILAGVLGFLLSWLYWSIATPKWLTWAYSKVQSKKELRERAELEKLIWPKGHFFERTMMMSKEKRQELERYEKQIEEGEEIEENHVESMFIYLRGSEFWAFVFIELMFIGLGTGSLVENILEEDQNGILFSVGVICFGLFILFKPIPFLKIPAFIPMARKYFKKEPQIEIHPEGISIRMYKTGLIRWDKVLDYDIEYEDGSAKEFNISYEYAEEQYKNLTIDLNDLKFDGVDVSRVINYHLNNNMVS